MSFLTASTIAERESLGVYMNGLLMPDGSGNHEHSFSNEWKETKKEYLSLPNNLKWSISKSSIAEDLLCL